MSITHHKLYTAYFLIQAVAGALWWIALFAFPQSRTYFTHMSWTDEPLMAFFLADALCFVGGSLLAAYAIGTKKPWAIHVCWFVAGAISFATLYCILVSLRHHSALLATAMMSASMICTCFLAWRTSFHERLDQ